MKTLYIVGAIAAIAGIGYFLYKGGNIIGNDQPGGAGSGIGGASNFDNANNAAPNTGIPTGTPTSFNSDFNQGTFSALDLYVARLPGSNTYYAPIEQAASVRQSIRSGGLQQGAVVFQNAAGDVVGAYNADQNVSLDVSAAKKLFANAQAGTAPDITKTGSQILALPPQNTAPNKPAITQPSITKVSTGSSTINYSPAPKGSMYSPSQTKPSNAGVLNRTAPTSSIFKAPTGGIFSRAAKV